MKNFEIDFLETYDDDSILKELKRIATVTGKKTVAKEDIEKTGNVSYTTIRRRFGSLRQALEKVGMQGRPEYKYKTYLLKSPDDAAIIEELKRMAEVTGKETVTFEDFQSVGHISYSIVLKRFGSLRQALEKAGLKIQRFTKSTEEELLHILVELWEQTLEKEGRRPMQTDLKKYGYPVSHQTIIQQFGSWRKALRRAFDSVNKETIEVEETATIPIYAPQEIVASKPPRKSLSLRKRFFVLKRDEFTCKTCGKSGIGVRLEVDHKVSVYDGGTDALDNLWTMCFECNRGKSKTSL